MKNYFSRWLQLALVGGLAVASCTGPAPVPTATLPAPVLAQVTEPVTLEPTPRAVEPTQISVSEDSVEAAESPATEAVPLYKGIPQGVTSDGFFYLGLADAPATLIDYSDFL